MAANVNRVLLAGNLTRDPVVRFLTGDKAVANFGLAINHRYKTADGVLKEETTFVDVEAWGRTAELVGQYLTKGRAAFVEGRLKLDSWDDAKTGEKRSKLKIVADSVQFLDSKPATAEGGGQQQQAAAGGAAKPAAQRPAPASDDNDEPPF